MSGRHTFVVVVSASLITFISPVRTTGQTATKTSAANLEDVKPGPGFVLPGRGTIPSGFVSGGPFTLTAISTERVVISGLRKMTYLVAMTGTEESLREYLGRKTIRLTPSAGFRQWNPTGIYLTSWEHPPADLGLKGELSYFHFGAFLPGVEHVWMPDETGEDQRWYCGKDPTREPHLSYVIRSDAHYPLTFKLSLDRKYTYLCGRGTVADDDDSSKGGYRFGMADTVDVYLPFMHGGPLEREGATQALGWLARTKGDIDKVIPALLNALKDGEMTVRRDAAEALGRIADPSATNALTALMGRESRL